MKLVASIRGDFASQISIVQARLLIKAVLPTTSKLLALRYLS